MHRPFCSLFVLYCLTVDWVCKSKHWPVLLTAPPGSTEPAAYSRVQFPQSPAHSPWEVLKRPARVVSLQSTVAAPCGCQQIPQTGSHWHTSHSAPSKWPDTENCSDPFRLDLSLINIRFVRSVHQMSSERWVFLYASAGRCIFTAHLSFGGAVPKRSYKICSPTALYCFIFLLWKEVKEQPNAGCDLN